MNRRYTRKQYLDKIDYLKRVCPGVAITSDIIVGFPGETEQDFEDTLSLIKEVGFDGLFAFVYSDRPNAPAVRFEDKVDEAARKERLQRVLACQEENTSRKHSALVGTIQEVLVDGGGDPKDSSGRDGKWESEGGILQWTGRTSTNKIVHFTEAIQPSSNNQLLTGQLLRIMIIEAMPHCLVGRLVLS
jgi:tRNA-2-methylthio-N6-dimethylallyladenosine synthase